MMGFLHFWDKAQLEDIDYRLKKGPIGLVYMDIARSESQESEDGTSATFNYSISEVAMQAAQFFDDGPLQVFNSQRVEHDFFLFICAKRTKDSNAFHDFDDWATKLHEHVKLHVAGLPWLHETVTFHYSHTKINKSLSKQRGLESSLYAAAKKAIQLTGKHTSNQSSIQSSNQSSKQHNGRDHRHSNSHSHNHSHDPNHDRNNAYEKKLKEFHNIVEQQIIRSVYQPIVSLEDGQVYGYEALSRGPKHSELHSPLELFRLAEKEGELYRLDLIARQKAVQGLKDKQYERKVFINIPAQIIHDPEFTPGQTRRMIEACGISPEQIVFEITERTSIEDFSTAKKILSHYRNQGYQIAIDDAGAGYSSLLAIAELQPDYIKIESALVQNIHRDKLKETVLETFVAFAQKLNIPLIAEGIEQSEDLMKLMEMGVQFGQGYFIGRPLADLHDTSAQARKWISEHTSTHTEQQANNSARDDSQAQALASFESSSAIATLAQPIFSMDEGTHVSEAWHYFEQNRQHQGIVVTRNKEPVGLIMREKLYWQLSVQYGSDLYWHRPVSRIMDTNSLIVEHHSPIEHISQQAMARELDKLYDFIIISKNKELLGIATVRSILEYITNIRIENARVVNPLTGLPGNLQIQRELSRRLQHNKAFSVVYADLDHFKWYNDTYGFNRGDQFIQYTAETILRSVASHGYSHDFVGHIGGDDYIIVTTTPSPEALCTEIIERFEAGSKNFYNDGEQNSESHQLQNVTDREGQQIACNSVTISLSLVDVTATCDGLTVDQLSRIAAELKQEAKQQKGSVFCRKNIGNPPAPPHSITR